MINLSSYILYNLSNLIFILLIPSSFTKLFFINYSIASGVFTFVTFYHFSKKNILSEKNIMIIVSVNILLIEIINSDIFTIWVYTQAIIYADYFFSQRKNFILNFFFKLNLLISSLLLYQDFLDPASVLKIKILIIYFSFIIYYFLSSKNKFIPLKINSPIIYNLCTCLIYFSSLLILTIILPNNFVKILYISFQIIIGLQLKLFDLKIRNINFGKFNIDLIFGIFSISYFIFLTIYSKIYYLIFFYLIVYLTLNFLKTKYIK